MTSEGNIDFVDFFMVKKISIIIIFYKKFPYVMTRVTPLGKTSHALYEYLYCIY